MNPAPSPQRWQNNTKAKAKAKAKLTPTFFSSLRDRELNFILVTIKLCWEFSGPFRGAMLTLQFLYGPLPPESFDTDENRTRNEAAETSFSRNDVKDIPKPGPINPGVNMKVNVVDWRAQELVSPNTPIDEDISG
uniref:Uncharacterized protein n=1 Tax=Salix viminalis TaxID=40686 RepID=A0A6N2NBY6_SALVM